MNFATPKVFWLMTVLLPLLDARRSEVYAGAYMLQQGEVRAVTGDVVLRPARLQEWLAGLELPGGAAFCGPDAERLAPPGFRVIATGRVLAGALARIALVEAAAGRAISPALAEANYVRRSDAEIFSKSWL